MRELHLFAGVGGGILGGMLLGHTPVGAVEISPFCRRVLAARQRDGVLPDFPIHDDVCTFDARPWRGRVDIVSGGFPCQPWSLAGKQRGEADDRNLWPEMARIVEQCRPSWVFAENVLLGAFEQCWRDLRRLGYRVPPALQLSAADAGAPHLRRRWWILAALPDADVAGLRNHEQWAEAGRDDLQAGRQAEPQHDGLERPVADAGGARLSVPECGGDARREPPHRGRREEGDAAPQRRWWSVEPRVGRVAHGVSHRVDRLRALGNAQVPIVAAAAFAGLMREHYARR